ncbi:uncharacterized hydrolase YugF-like [Lytechinus variegatus]|uniref:uncharacterized hydrolase YugF-like n=1 Tax=Lytechinus variegatus TaxID=7654 RepID=UPI001BB2A65E|nr:uncharacterized hydrolase YugF-like [Lytechinus variegatus]
MSGQSPSQRVAKPDECDYALVQDMGEGFRRGTSKISAIGTSFTMVYGEWVAAGSTDGDESPVVICIHGTPATEGAFRPLGSRIAAEGYRVLAVNFPGMGYTEMDSERRFDFSVTHKAELVKAFIFKLEISRVTMLIGHSTGGQVIGHLAADRDLENIVQSVCFLCSTGVQPYGSQKYSMVPYLPYLLYRAIYLPVLGPVLMYLASMVVHRLGFRAKTPEAGVMSIYEGHQMRFDVFAKDLTRLGERQIPVLLVYGLRDRIVEPESIPEIIALLDIPESNVKEFNDEDEPNITFHGDSVRRVVCFKTGTHRLHFKKTELVLEEIFSFLGALSKKSR